MDGDHFKMDARPSKFSRGITSTRITRMLATKAAEKSNPRERSTDWIPISFVGAAFVMERSRTLERMMVMQMVRTECWSVNAPKTLRKSQEAIGSDMIAMGPPNNKNIIGR